MHELKLRKALIAGAVGALLAAPAIAQKAYTPPASVNESAPATTGPATTPTHSTGRAGEAVMPKRGAPGMVSESQPATTGAASTPTAGQGRSGLPPHTEPMGRLPDTPSTVSESAPARTGPATVPTNSYGKWWKAADLDRDGYVTRAEFDRWAERKGWMER